MMYVRSSRPRETDYFKLLSGVHYTKRGRWRSIAWVASALVMSVRSRPSTGCLQEETVR